MANGTSFSYSKYSSNEESMDILSMKDPSKKSDLFRVSFAFYSASPYLMILPAKEREDDVELGIFPTKNIELERQQRGELLKVAQDVINMFGLTKDILLSIHIGKWRNCNNPVQARLCFGPERARKYLEIFDEMKKYPPMCNFWPSECERFAMNGSSTSSHWWILKKNPPTVNNIEELHHKEVQNKVFDHKRMDTRGLRAVRRDTLLTPTLRKSKNPKYHDQSPKIGLPWNCAHELKDVAGIQQYINTLYNLYAELNELIQPYDSTDHRGNFQVPGCNGAHICVSLGKEGLPGFDHTDGPVLGYVHISAASFYRVLPEDRRRDWFGKYWEWDGVVYT